MSGCADEQVGLSVWLGGLSGRVAVGCGGKFGTTDMQLGQIAQGARNA